jgi:hypothetical protein
MNQNQTNQNKQASFWVAVNEVSTKHLQQQLSKLAKEVQRLKFENQVLRMKCGETADRINSIKFSDADVDQLTNLKNALMSWGDVASFLPVKEIAFLGHLFMCSIRAWISQDFRQMKSISCPMEALGNMLQDIRNSSALDDSFLDSFAHFVASVIVLRKYDTSHRDLILLGDLMREMILSAISFDLQEGPQSNIHGLLEKLLLDDSTRCLLSLVSCRMCSEMIKVISKEIIGKSNQPHPNELDSDFDQCRQVLLISEACLENLAGWCQASHLSGPIMEEIADLCIDISRTSDIISEIFPVLCLLGKRLYCLVISGLQELQ